MIHNVIQGSAEWFELKLGKVTSSRVAHAIAVLKRKDGESADRRDLKRKIMREIMTGKHAGGFVSDAMRQGTEREPLARTEYEIRTGWDVRLVGYVDHPTIERAGASPDGLVGKDGCIEIKCPLGHTHIDYLIKRAVPAEYEPQVQWVMACTGRQWCDFVSFDPEQAKRHQLLIVRVLRDGKRIAEMESAVLAFLSEVDELLAQIEAGEDFLVKKLEESVDGFALSDADIQDAMEGRL